MPPRRSRSHRASPRPGPPPSSLGKSRAWPRQGECHVSPPRIRRRRPLDWPHPRQMIDVASHPGRASRERPPPAPQPARENEGGRRGPLLAQYLVMRWPTIVGVLTLAVLWGPVVTTAAVIQISPTPP